MRKLTFILILLMRTCSPAVAQTRNIYTAQYPITISFDKKVGSDSLWNMGIVQNDSLKNAYNSIKGVSDTGKANMIQINVVSNQEKTDVAALKITDGNLQTQINNIVVPPTSGIPPPLVKTGNYTLQLSDYDKSIFVNCASCTISCPVLQAGFRVFIIRDGNGAVNVRPSGIVSVTGAASITAKQGGQWLVYKSSSTANLQVR